MIELVTLRRGAPGAAAQHGVRPRHVAAEDRAASPRSRRSCAAPAALKDDGERRRVAPADPRLPHQRRDPQLRQRRRCRALQPAPACVTPDHTIRTKNWPLIVPPPEAGKLDDFKRAVHSGGAHFHRTTTRAISRATMRALGGVKHDARSAAARRAGAGPRPVRPRPQQARTRASPPTSPKRRSRRITDAEAIGRFEFDQRSRHVRHGILVARAGQARHAKPSCRSPARSR